MSVSGCIGVYWGTELINWGPNIVSEPWNVKSYPLYGAVPHAIYVLGFLVSMFTGGNIKWLVRAASLNTVVWPIYGYATVLVWSIDGINPWFFVYYLSNIFYACYVVGVLTRLAKKQKEKGLATSEAVVTLVS